MNALEYCNRHVKFARPGSPVTGNFDTSHYRFLEKFLLWSSDPTLNRLVTYKSSSCMGTLGSQCVLAYRIERQLGDILFVCQTDEDAAQFTVTRAKEFIFRIPSIERMVKKDKYAITNNRWLFSHKFVLIGGPGEANQQSKQTLFLMTDESHLAAYFPPGTLESFEKRMGRRWNRFANHITTAADKGAEVDKMYNEGGQNEFHLRCPNCVQLIWPLWEEYSTDFYNGHKVFQWEEKDSDNWTLETLRLVCPHCGKDFKDTSPNRFEFQTNGDYVEMNPGRPSNVQSCRWSVFGFYYTPWIDHLMQWKRALRDEKMGDLSTMEDFIKKTLCMSYEPKLHDLGGDGSMKNYALGQVWITEEDRKRVVSIDVQDSPLHFWAQCDEFSANGDSRRVAYTRLESWGQVKQFQLYQNVSNSEMAMDIGHLRAGEVLGKLAEWKWFGLKSGDGAGFNEFTHMVNGVPTRNPYYSPVELQDSRIGKKGKRQPINLATTSRIPPGWVGYRLWSKQNVGLLLLRLKSGASGRYYGIPTDIRLEYEKQLHTYIEAIDKNAKRGTSQLFLKQLSEEDHSFATSSMNIITAMCAGFFPVAISGENHPNTQTVPALVAE